MDATTTSLRSLQDHTTSIADKMPDIEGIIKMLRWLVEAVKWVVGFAILAGALAGGQTIDVIKVMFG